MKTIIVIPYRKRQSHLLYFIKNSAPLLKKNIPNLEILIVEQDNKFKFNRGKLLNIGFHYYDYKLYNNTYNYIFHDVDINPIHKSIIKKYKDPVKNGLIQGIYNNSYSLGGVFKFNAYTFRKTNGYPNNFWGWGYEDDCLQQRAKIVNVNIRKMILTTNPKISKYFKIFNNINDRITFGYNAKKIIGKKVMKSNKQIKIKYVKYSGLNTLRYKINKKIKVNNYITVIQVSL